MELKVYCGTEGYDVIAAKDTVQGELEWYVPAGSADGAVLTVAHYLQAGLHRGMEARCPACQQIRAGLEKVDALVAEKRAALLARGRTHDVGDVPEVRGRPEPTAPGDGSRG